ncbi:hypothetical protein Tco_0742222, partial [Tanacetum coccineum]
RRYAVSSLMDTAYRFSE